MVQKHYYPYYNEEGEHVANKVRNLEKKAFFLKVKFNKLVCLDNKLLEKTVKYITIWGEGEIDAASAYQMLGSK